MVTDVIQPEILNKNGIVQEASLKIEEFDTVEEAIKYLEAKKEKELSVKEIQLEETMSDLTSEEVAIPVSLEEIKETNSVQNEVNSQSMPTFDGVVQSYYRPVIPELHIDAAKEGDFRAFNVVVREREGKDFDKIYNYFVAKGTFDYLNKGNLKQGDRISFMIDPTFDDVTIFMAHTKADGTYQVVGSLDSAKK